MTYEWSTALCLCLCLCRPSFHLSELRHKQKQKRKKNELVRFSCAYVYVDPVSICLHMCLCLCLCASENQALCVKWDGFELFVMKHVLLASVNTTWGTIGEFTLSRLTLNCWAWFRDNRPGSNRSSEMSQNLFRWSDRSHENTCSVTLYDSGSVWADRFRFNIGYMVWFPYNGLGPVVRKKDSVIHWINLYPVDGAIGFPNT